MRERPILFSAPMVRALLAGTKTQTRRVCRSQPYPNGFKWDGQDFLCHNDYLPPSAMLMDVRRGKHSYTTSDVEGWASECPYGQPGDRLWVREAWMPDPPCDGTWAYTEWAGCRTGQIAAVPERFRHPAFCNYRASWLHSTDGLRWTPGIHMFRWASRILLEVTDVRVERLQDISEADARAEGVDVAYDTKDGHGCQPSYYRGYMNLWDHINGDGSWDANPWVWCVSFRRIGSADEQR